MSTCDTTTCVPCDVHDDCGCINPTTFECITIPGTCEALGITDDMDGKEVIAQICTEVGTLKSDKGKVIIDSSDTCPEPLWDKLEEGLNITFTQTGTGCNRKIVINAVEGGVPIDENFLVSDTDTTTGHLYDKLDPGTYLTKNILNPGGNEILQLEVDPALLVSTDPGNQITLGSDGALKTTYTAPDGSETKVVQGSGVTVTGTGTLADPYVVATNPSISVVRSCFDSVWRPITLVSSGNLNVVYVSGAPQYRYRYDGTIEFRGSITYNVTFGAYTTGNRKYTIPLGNIPSTCLTLSELAGTADLKGINYIDVPGAGDQITQEYGYIIRKSTQNFLIEFQSAYLASSTTKTIVVNFEGAVSHPSI